MRLRMKTRFLKLYRYFRLRKYGEPLGPPLPARRHQLSSPSKLLEKSPAILNIVEEEPHESDDFDRDAFLAQLAENVYEDIIYEYVLLHADSLVRAVSFLHMVIVRHRYLKLKQASSTIQGRCRRYLAVNRVKKMRLEKIEAERTLRLEKHLKLQQLQQDRARVIEEAAVRIQSLYHRMKFRNELKAMR
jgi:hypothetical protein